LLSKEAAGIPEEIAKRLPVNGERRVFANLALEPSIPGLFPDIPGVFPIAHYPFTHNNPISFSICIMYIITLIDRSRRSDPERVTQVPDWARFKEKFDATT
jgi:hypothetical protein